MVQIILKQCKGVSTQEYPMFCFEWLLSAHTFCLQALDINTTNIVMGNQFTMGASGQEFGRENQDMRNGSDHTQ